MSLTCCTRFQRVVKALSEFQIRNRKFKPASLLTGFSGTTDTSHLLRVFSQFGSCSCSASQKKKRGCNFPVTQCKILIGIQKKICNAQDKVSPEFYFCSAKLLCLALFKPFKAGQWSLLNRCRLYLWHL